MEKRLIHKTNVCHWVGLFSLHHNLFYNYIFQECDHFYDILYIYIIVIYWIHYALKQNFVGREDMGFSLLNDDGMIQNIN